MPASLLELTVIPDEPTWRIQANLCNSILNIITLQSPWPGKGTQSQILGGQDKDTLAGLSLAYQVLSFQAKQAQFHQLFLHQGPLSLPPCPPCPVTRFFKNQVEMENLDTVFLQD